MPLDADLAAFLRSIEGEPRLHELDVPAARAAFARQATWLREQAATTIVRHTEDRTLDGPTGPVVARTWWPETDEAVPTVLWVHGGGWVVGDRNAYDAMCRRLCVDANAAVVGVDFRLAPEHPFPAGLDDVMAAARWLAREAADIGGSRAWGIAGDSGGGNLAAVATHLLRDEDVPAPSAQLLGVYPSVDMRGPFASRTENGHGYWLETMGWFSRHYLGGADPDDPRLSPLRFRSHAGLPPAVIVTAELDPLRDEGTAYAAALTDAGVTVDLQAAAGMIHGFFDMGTVSPAAAAAVRHGGEAFGKLLRDNGSD